jgi:anti-anti-sigma factor
MIGMPPTFEIIESEVGRWLRLTLVGELDLGSAPTLERRIARLRAMDRAVRLDLSQLAFIDSTGLHLLIRSIGDARANDWELEIEPELSPPVMRLFRLARLDRLIFNGEYEPPPARAAANAEEQTVRRGGC